MDFSTDTDYLFFLFELLDSSVKVPLDFYLVTEKSVHCLDPLRLCVLIHRLM